MPQKLYPEAFPLQQKLLSMPFSADNLAVYESARSSVDSRQPFRHDDKDWIVTKIVMSITDECEIYGVAYRAEIFDCPADEMPKWAYAGDARVRPSHC